MRDRIPGAPGQYKAVVTSAELQKMQNAREFSITLTRDDQPLVEGTPYSTAAVLPNAVASELCPGVEDPTPADAFRAAATHIKNQNNPHKVSAAQVGAYPVGKPTLTNVDLNGYMEKTHVGTYWCGEGCLNAPFEKFYTLEVHLDFQRATHYKTGEIRCRTYNAGAWTDWKEANDLQGHLNNKSNPHGVTAGQVGAYPVGKPTLTNVDLNAYKEKEHVGSYWCGEGCSNAPFEKFFNLEVHLGFQRATHYKTGEVRSRTYNSNAWSQWQKADNELMETVVQTIGTLNKHLNNEENPHQITVGQIGAVPTTRTINGQELKTDITLFAADIGLGNVPNLATNDQKPTYTVASSLSALSSGEKLSTAFGKIAKAVKDFKSYKESTVTIVEEGIKSYWYYRKWSDGYAECWRTISGSADVDYVWGSVYSSVLSANIQAAYPFPFTEKPVVQFSPECAGSGNYWIASNAEGTLTVTPNIQIVNGTSRKACKYEIHVYACGKYA